MVGGPGVYQADGTSPGWMGEADAAVYPLRWFGLVMGQKTVVITDYALQSLRISGRFAAIRVRWGY